MTLDFLESLLYEEEGDRLDFKSRQYQFVGATTDEKCELLKDILAFANSWTTGDAFVLIGVKEIKGATSEIVGILEHIDDASLQQFVTSKTNKPVDFSYKALGTPEGEIGVITISRQARPIYLRNDFGRLKANVVYYRRGSSTLEATPDEIIRMGQVLEAPSLVLELADKREDKLIGRSLSVKSTILRYEEHSIPFYGKGSTPVQMAADFHGTDNRKFYHEYAAYKKVTSFVEGVRFGATNTGSQLLSNVIVKCEFEARAKLLVFDQNDYPKRPSRTNGISSESFVNLHQKFTKTRSIGVRTVGHRVLITAHLLDIQPHASVFTANRIFFGCASSEIILFWAKVFADNLPRPLDFDFKIDIEPYGAELDVGQMVARLEKSAP